MLPVRECFWDPARFAPGNSGYILYVGIESWYQGLALDWVSPQKWENQNHPPEICLVPWGWKYWQQRCYRSTCLLLYKMKQIFSAKLLPHSFLCLSSQLQKAFRGNPLTKPGRKASRPAQQISNVQILILPSSLQVLSSNNPCFMADYLLRPLVTLPVPHP